MTGPVPVPERITRALAAVEAPDADWAERAGRRQGSLTMPPGGLGRLLELGRQLAAIQRTDRPRGDPALVAVLAADHGVAEAGVSAYPQAVTGQMLANYLSGGAAVNVLARRAGATLRVADLGVKHPPEDVHPSAGFVSRPIRRGTANLRDGPALTRVEAFEAVCAGLDLAETWVADAGVRVVGLGEMGIGNSTTAAVVIAALTGREPRDLVGRGTGVDDAGFDRKCAVAAAAFQRHVRHDVPLWDVMAGIGGLEILGLAGLALGSAAAHALVVVDGLISASAALFAAALCPAVVGSMVAAHLGPEPGHRVALDQLGLVPLLNLGLRLGEGTGAALALPIIASAADILRDMATFAEAGVSGRLDH